MREHEKFINSYEDLKLQNKLEKINDEELVKLIKEAKRIREEIGDNPEIKNIERNIVTAKTYKNKRVVIMAIRLLFAISCFGAGAYAMYINKNVDLSCLLLNMIGIKNFAYFQNMALDDDTSKLPNIINDIKNSIRELELSNENKKLKQELEKLKNEYTEQIEEDTNVKRR